MNVGIRVLIKWANREAAERMVKATRLMKGVLEDMPWRDDLREAIEDVEYASENIKVQGEEDATP